MSVVIRLARTGKKGERKFRIVVKEKRSARDGEAIETLGWWEKGTKNGVSEIKRDRYKYWISMGAQPSLTVENLLKE